MNLASVLSAALLLLTSLHAETLTGRVEQCLEVPLDSISARQLCRAAGRGVLPRWLGVKHLTPEASAA